MPKILITGCPRSGTKAIARYYQKKGLDIGHEETKTNGTVNCFLWNGDYKGWTEIIHLVREPLACINSLYDLARSPHHMKRMELPQGKDKLKDTVRYWVLVNSHVMRRGKTRRLETWPDLEHVGGHKKHWTFSWHDLYNRVPIWTNYAFTLARRFGYGYGDLWSR